MREMVAVFEMAAGCLREDAHWIYEYYRDMGTVHVFLIVQSLRLGKR